MSTHTSEQLTIAGGPQTVAGTKQRMWPEITDADREAILHAVTGRDKLIKFQGCYHACHDYLLGGSAENARAGAEQGIVKRRRDPRGRSSGELESAAAETLVCGYNDLQSVESARGDRGGGARALRAQLLDDPGYPVAAIGGALRYRERFSTRSGGDVGGTNNDKRGRMRGGARDGIEVLETKPVYDHVYAFRERIRVS